MSRLFYVSGDPSLAKRTLHLYVQIVSKAFEAGSLSLDVTSKEGEDDVRWVETLVEGSRMLCRIASVKTGLDGREEAREAGVLIRKVKESMRQKEDAGSREDGLILGSNKEMSVRVLLAEGIWNSIMAIKGKHHLSRLLTRDPNYFARTRPPNTPRLLHTISPSSQPIGFYTPDSFRVLPPSVCTCKTRT